MTKLAPEWVRTNDPVIRSPARYRWATAPAPFGLCNAPATFERLMSQVMCGLHWKRCLVYIDNILVFGNDFESALHSLELVLIRVAEYGLQLQSTKCNLFRTSVPFLGHIVGRAGLECDPNKLSAVANWIPPCTIKGVRKFLGFTGYYRRFVPRLLNGRATSGTLTGERL